MSAYHRDLPIHAPISRSSLETAFIHKVLGKREAARLTGLLENAERAARKRIDQATREAEEIFAHAKQEAETILGLLPDFAALEALNDGQGRSAYRIIRAICDRHGLPMYAVMQRGDDFGPKATEARHEAVRAIAARFTSLRAEHIADLFHMSPKYVVQIVKEGR